MSHLRIHMPRGGEDGVLVMTDERGWRVEFRGPPWSEWGPDEATLASPFYYVHSSLVTIDISALHCGEVQTATPWNQEWRYLCWVFTAATHEVAV